jgi:hypothetical protein
MHPGIGGLGVSLAGWVLIDRGDMFFCQVDHDEAER